MNLLRSNAQHPGWPLDVGPLRVPAGVVRLRAVRMRDGAQWSRIRLADREHLEPWEPSSGRRLDTPAHRGRVAGAVFRSAFGGAQRPDAAVRHRARRTVLRSADHRQRHPRGACVRRGSATGFQGRRLAAGWPPARWRWVSTIASVRSCCIGWRPPCGRRTRRAGPCWQRLDSVKRVCCAATSKSTERGETTC